jgi:transcriptional regulator with XRE-family HTH domain
MVMPVSVKALVKPELLVWARTSAQLTVEEAAVKAQVKKEKLANWERGEEQPSLPQLRKLGRVYKRPLAVFYLPTPPKMFAALRDFRRLPVEVAGRQSPELAFEIRRARARREIALDLYEELVGEPHKPFTVPVGVDEDAETVGVRLREHQTFSETQS